MIKQLVLVVVLAVPVGISTNNTSAVKVDIKSASGKKICNLKPLPNNFMESIQVKSAENLTLTALIESNTARVEHEPCDCTPNSFLCKGQWAEGIEYYKKLLQYPWKSARRGVLLSELSSCLGHSGYFDEAIAVATEAIRLSAKSELASAVRRRGYAFMQKHNFEVAELHFETAAKLDPSMDYTWFCLGLTKTALGKTEEAKVAFKKARDNGSDFNAPIERGTVAMLNRTSSIFVNAPR